MLGGPEKAGVGAPLRADRSAIKRGCYGRLERQHSQLIRKKVAQETGCSWTKAVSRRLLVHLNDPEVFR
jgi:hypothetical protein